MAIGVTFPNRLGAEGEKRSRYRQIPDGTGFPLEVDPFSYQHLELSPTVETVIGGGGEDSAQHLEDSGPSHRDAG